MTIDEIERSEIQETSTTNNAVDVLYRLYVWYTGKIT